ncbi:GNAT family N-acetyltransferase [Caulobacter vibrioides]|uniref:Acetyltransferase, GNAT family n=2 Tax=Caulobacter vibrioides TaxID=155892 RepID=Q9AB32_CAUVC|nr:GNAT family N-acetyltransferase [Caulobacter vibrioides]YP_002515782.2 acetyltransferase [Caulobacter vibrioides NA1000]AAK22389.1 acetyltransferase, GNAT family [Caulobacter vibrioides CB15]ACL93874.2 acetyltransferase [Caulobacter vibrioides NA1000]ATC27233.1 N-acetyltransferase [Caulobacter vibrioides]QXZ52494.1 GNAT family N-acetyltransferase [Caulobacter vibrioides]
MTVTVRPATPADAGLIHQFILDLAEYEKLLDTVQATPADTAAALFGEKARAFADIAEIDGQPMGFALWFYNYSTFVGRHGIYLEDLFVRPSARGSGAGKALLANLAKRCLDEGLGRLEWTVLDWNAPSIAFYDSLDAAAMDEWIIRRMTGEALRKLAGV